MLCLSEDSIIEDAELAVAMALSAGGVSSSREHSLPSQETHRTTTVLRYSRRRLQRHDWMRFTYKLDVEAEANQQKRCKRIGRR